MKPSYFQTPRTLNEATFYGWADPLTRPEVEKTHPADKAIYVLCVLAVVLVFWLIKGV
jgi:hypothetical protein